MQPRVTENSVKAGKRGHVAKEAICSMFRQLIQERVCEKIDLTKSFRRIDQRQRDASRQMASKRA